MARLNKDESLALVRVFVKAQNHLKGAALDQARMAFPETPEDRQFGQFSKSLKDKESSLRQVFVKALVEAELIEPLENAEIFSMS